MIDWDKYVFIFIKPQFWKPLVQDEHLVFRLKNNAGVQET